jgi:putative transport protein
MDWLQGVMKAHPEIAFFLVLGVGYLFGKLSLGSFKLGAVTGTLLAGVLVGQLGVTLSNDVKQCFFLLFLFAIGFRTGPQFFRGLRSDGLHHAALAAIVALTGLLVGWGVSLLLGYDVGTAAGLLAGSLTESATIGTAMDAISKLDLAEAGKTELHNQIPVAFAVTYLVGVIGAAWLLSQLAPRLMRVDLAEECRKYEVETLGSTASAQPAARREFELRAYEIASGSPWAGRRVRDFEAAGGTRVFIERVRSRGQVIDAELDLQLRLGDTVAVSGPRTTLVEVLEADGTGLLEVDDRELLDMTGEMLDVVITSRAVDGQTLAELGRAEAARGVFLRRVTRGGTPLALLPNLAIQRGDVVTIVGLGGSVARAAAMLGVADRVTDVTDMLVVAMGIVAGAMIGLPALDLGGVELGLSLPVGVLLGGLVCGYLRTVQPRWFGRIPSPTLWIFESIGLTGFVAVVGLNAGPDFVRGVQQSGLSLVGAGAVTVATALLVGVIVGRWVFRMHPGVLLGVCAGGCTATPALAAVQEAARSSVPSLGYGVAYAVGNVLLAVWGTVIVVLLT